MAAFLLEWGGERLARRGRAMRTRASPACRTALAGALRPGVAIEGRIADQSARR